MKVIYIPAKVEEPIVAINLDTDYRFKDHRGKHDPILIGRDILTEYDETRSPWYPTIEIARTAGAPETLFLLLDEDAHLLRRPMNPRAGMFYHYPLYGGVVVTALETSDEDIKLVDWDSATWIQTFRPFFTIIDEDNLTASDPDGS